MRDANAQPLRELLFPSPTMSAPSQKPRASELKAIPASGVFAIVCAWCGNVISMRSIEGDSIVSHGICSDCRDGVKSQTAS